MTYYEFELGENKIEVADGCVFNVITDERIETYMGKTLREQFIKQITFNDKNFICAKVDESCGLYEGFEYIKMLFCALSASERIKNYDSEKLNMVSFNYAENEKVALKVKDFNSTRKAMYLKHELDYFNMLWHKEDFHKDRLKKLKAYRAENGSTMFVYDGYYVIDTDKDSSNSMVEGICMIIENLPDYKKEKKK